MATHASREVEPKKESARLTWRMSLAMLMALDCFARLGPNVASRAFSARSRDNHAPDLMSCANAALLSHGPYGSRLGRQRAPQAAA